ncbi:TrkH family potassium uptake protein [Seonamhaeicola sp. ML3]|uniref:TrkH family potassium uptake protein n=1 Tax=Seonamhaeicola sp. ML3 TaxID=2937786 RepID=UPI00200ECF0B|nr:potassium transporter TrkG [Seonamhaeicola sp. ML3]
MLPFCRNNNISIIDHIFFSVSLVSTTGLAPLNFAESYSMAGQIISLFFIQLGGVGYMALSSFVILKRHNKVPLISAKLLRLEFNLPQKYPLLAFIHSVFIFTFLIEFIGAIFLYIGFKQEAVSQPLWQAIFHSISAFCTAGFSLFENSMTPFSNNGYITNTIMVLSLLGSIGFIVLLDIWFKLRQKKAKITLTSKIILLATFVFIVLPTCLIYSSDSNLQRLGWEGFRLAFFQTVSAHTTVGFNNHDLGTLGIPAIFVFIIVMVVGASPAGTGGGIKTTSVTALYAVLTAILKRRKRITFLSKLIPSSKIYLAIASGIFYALILIIGIWTVLIIDGNNFSLSEIAFECSSALSTVGLSTGITGTLSNTSKTIVALLMFIGRLGVLTFGFALITKSPLLDDNIETEDIAI